MQDKKQINISEYEQFTLAKRDFRIKRMNPTSPYSGKKYSYQAKPESQIAFRDAITGGHFEEYRKDLPAHYKILSDPADSSLRNYNTSRSFYTNTLNQPFQRENDIDGDTEQNCNSQPSRSRRQK